MPRNRHINALDEGEEEGILKRIEEWNFTAFHRLHAISIEPATDVSRAVSVSSTI